MKIGFAMCGSFCTYAAVFPIIEELAAEHDIYPIVSPAAATTDTRFGTAEAHIRRLTELCGRAPLRALTDVEPIGPKRMLDVLVIAPCTGNTLAKLSRGIADTAVTMAAKSHLRNGKAVVLGISTNDGLSGAAENIGRLLDRRNFYFVPFGQDDALGKPRSLVAKFEKLPQTIDAAVQGYQLQPILAK